MGQNTKCLERLSVNLLGGPKDINSSATAIEYFNLSKIGRALILVLMGDGTATSGDITVTLSQATTAAGGSDKVLNALSTGRIYSQYAADLAAYAALTTGWTEETQAVADEVWTDATSGESVGIIALEVRAEDLDVANGFAYCGVILSATSSAKICALLVIGLDPANQSGVTGMANPLV